MSPPRRVGLADAVEWAKGHPALYQAARAARLWAGRNLARPSVVPGVPGRVHPNDLMMAWRRPGRAAAYAAGGAGCLALIEQALAAVGRSAGDVSSWLDFGCGHGRVLRHLVQAVPPGRIWAADLNPEAVAFCASELGVSPLDGTDLAVPDGRRFEVIYAFSVVTHLPEEAGLELLARFGRALAPGGVLLFTTHGERSLGLIEHQARWLVSQAEDIRAEVSRGGFSYRPYPHYRGGGYGMAWHSAGWLVDAMAELHGDAMRLVSHLPHALEGVQDAFVYQRR